MFIQPTYELDISLEWEEYPASWTCDGSRTKYQGVWINYMVTRGNGTTRIEVAHGRSVPTPLKQALVDGGTDFFPLSSTVNWDEENPVRPVKFDVEPGTTDVTEFLQFIIDTVDENGNATDEVGPGVQFAGTPDEGRGERDWMSGLTMAQQNGWKTSYPTCGSNLRHEHIIGVGRIDATEVDADGNIITVIECQSGIQYGQALDAEHFEKSISRYPYAPEVRNTVKKVIVIAGGFTDSQVEAFRHTPFTSILLKTIKTEAGTIALEQVL